MGHDLVLAQLYKKQVMFFVSFFLERMRTVDFVLAPSAKGVKILLTHIKILAKT